LNDLYRRGLEGQNLELIVTDGCPGLAAAIQTVYPRALHQRCWVHKMRNILEKVRRRDHDQVKADAQAIYQAHDRKQAQAAFRRFRSSWQRHYPGMVRQLARDLPELLSFFSFSRHLCRKLRTTNIIERCFVEVRRRIGGPWSASSTSRVWTGSSTPFFKDSTWNGKTAPSGFLHKQLDVTVIILFLI